MRGTSEGYLHEKDSCACLCHLLPVRTGLSFADDAAKQLAGTWKVVSLITKFDGGDAVEPFGPNPKGRLVLTPEGQWIIILTAANREPAKSLEEKAALLNSMLAYSGRYTTEGNRMTIRGRYVLERNLLRSQIRIRHASST